MEGPRAAPTPPAAEPDGRRLAGFREMRLIEGYVDDGVGHARKLARLVMLAAREGAGAPR